MKLIYRELHGYKYETLSVYRVETDIAKYVRSPYITISTEGWLVIHKRYAWNGTSGPIRDTKENQKPSLVHDAYCQLIREGLLDKKYRKYADQEFKRMCIENGISKFAANCMYIGLRLFGAKGCKPAKKPRGKIVTID